MTDYNQTIILNGIDDFSLFGDSYSWEGRYISRLRAALDDGDTGFAELVLRADFDIEVARFNGDPAADMVIRDEGDGDRSIGLLRLPDGTAELRLAETRVDIVRGFGESYDLTFGRYVDFVQLGDGDHVLRVEDGGRAAFMGGGDNLVEIRGGNLENVKFQDGNNTLILREGAFFESAQANAGDNTFVLEDGFGQLTFGRGSNEVTFARGFGGSITGYSEEDSVNSVTLGGEARLRSLGVSNGQDTLVLDAGASIEQAQLGGGDDSATLGENASISTLNLGGGNNRLEINGGGIQMALAFSGDDAAVVRGESGIVGELTLGRGNNSLRIEGGARIDTFTAFDGNDTVRIADGQIGLIQVSGGDNLVVTADRFVQGIFAYEGDDTVRVGTGGAGMVKLDHGDNSVTARGFVDSVVTFDGADTIGVGGGARYVGTGGGNDTLLLGYQGISLADAGQGDDLIRVGFLAGDQGMRIDGGGGTDTIDMGLAGTGLDLGLSRGNDLGANGFYSLSGIENLIATTGNDRLAGDDGDNVLTGRAGADVFVFDRADGTDTITDFALGEDLIRLQGVSSAAQVSFGQQGADVRLDYFDTTVLVEDVTVDQLARVSNFEL